MVKNIYKKLTTEQKNKGVVFASTLSEYQTEQYDNTIHEVLDDDTNKEQKINNLKDDGFFNDSPFKYNIIRE